MIHKDHWLRYGFLIAGALASLTCAGCGSGNIAAPTAYANLNSSAGTFACDYPEGWTAESSTGHRGMEWATFTSGPATIHIEAGTAGSLVGDIAKNIGGQSGELGPDSEPVYTVHMNAKESAEKEFNGYTDLDTPQVIDMPLGPARRNEFTSSTTFGTGMHGYRATVLGHDKAVYVSCTCPESNWATLKPAYDHVLASLRRGEAQ